MYVYMYVCMYVCMYVFIKLHITTQSGPVILVILCHSHWSSRGGINDTYYVCMYVCMYACIYVCMVITYSRLWINRLRLPILLVVSQTGKMNIPLSPYAPENLVSRDGFSRPVPRQPAHPHTQAECGAYLRDSSRVNSTRVRRTPTRLWCCYTYISSIAL